ncbi:hypothetical protein L3073_17205 [Ancylomarina sp. DW003]|nr:hypothetical protein [Ancylomarina sp. DW003]MDE5423955.1 hypothetical protein [Ancylomarina sp. DW003]
MKNKLGLFIYLMVFVIIVAGAQNNFAHKIDNNLNDYEVEDEFDEDFNALSYSFEKFEDEVNVLHYQNYKKQMCISEEGQYITAFMQGMDDRFLIVAMSNQGFQTEIKNSKYEHFIYKGKEYYFGKIWNEEKGKYADHILLLECPQYNIVISIMSPMSLSKENLLGIVSQLHF